jgi:predicted peptidase
VENFVQYTYTEEDGTELMYSLYLPEDYDENTGYPLVLFMPDATGEGDDPYLALTESLGSVI